MRRFALAGFALLAMLALAMAAAVQLGAEPVSLRRAFSEPGSMDATIVLSARLPRVALAAMAGAALSVVGVAFQALLRTPLAAP